MKTRLVLLLVLAMFAAAVPRPAAAQLLSSVVPVSLVGFDFDEDDLPPLRLAGPRELVTATPANGGPRGVMAFPVSALVDGTEVVAEEHRCPSAGQRERIEVVLGPRGRLLPAAGGCRRIPLKGSFAWNARGGVINLETREVSSGTGDAAQPRADVGGPIFRLIQMRFTSGIGTLRTNFAKRGCERFNTDLSRASPQCDGDDTARSVQAGLDVSLEFAPQLNLLLGGVYRNNTGVWFDAAALSGTQRLTNFATGEIKKVWQGKVGLEWRPVDRLAVSGYWAPAHRWSTGTFSDELLRDSIRVAGGTTTSVREDSDHRMSGASLNYRIAGPWGAQFDYFTGSHPNAFPAINNARAPQDVDASSLVVSLSHTLVTYRRPGPLNLGAAAAILARQKRAEAHWYGGVNVGFSGNWGQAAGDANPFSRGTPFVTFSGLPAFFVPSWNFGHGAEILNSVAADFATTARVAPLDDVLTSGRTMAVGRGIHYDATLGRVINDRFGVYGRLAFASNPLELPGEARNLFDSTSLTSATTWMAVTRGGSGTATSLTTYEGGTGGRMAATAGVQLRTGWIGDWQPSFNVGAGAVWYRDAATGGHRHRLPVRGRAGAFS